MTVTPRSVHSIDHYALFVPSLAEARTFFASFGLEVGETADALELRAADGHRWARMLQGPRKSLAYLSFNCFAEDYDALRQQAEVAGARFEAGDGEGFWFRDPDGNLLQVRVGAKHMPDSKRAAAPAQPAVRGVGTRDEVARVRPRRLSHVLLFSPDVPQAVLAMAILVSSPVSRAVANFFISLARPRFPTRLFTDDDAALAWLRGFQT